MKCSRRDLVKRLGAAAVVGTFGHSLGALAAGNAAPSVPGNFRYIYGDRSLRAEFKDFLSNVFHLYPEDALHERIESLSSSLRSDEEIYRALQSDIRSIKPMLGDLTYALPTLIKQKQGMAEQTASLLDSDRRYEGYLEIGSTGRYLDLLEERVEIVGERFMLSPIPATFSIMDMVDRGQLLKAGTTIDLGDYQPQLAKHVGANTFDLVTVYIGFHHCPIALRKAFLEDIRETMKAGGYLVVRDHDAHDEKMRRVVGLAHDVFNMGTHETWSFNAHELRHFYSLKTLDEMLAKAGFKSDGRQLHQSGDPTLNALMVYRKV